MPSQLVNFGCIIQAKICVRGPAWCVLPHEAIFSRHYFDKTLFKPLLKSFFNSVEKFSANDLTTVCFLFAGRIFSHPNIQPVLGCSNSPPSLVVVSQYQEHASLYDVLHRGSGVVVDTAQALRFALDVARGMCFLHRLEKNVPDYHLSSRHVVVGAGRQWEGGALGPRMVDSVSLCWRSDFSA